MRKTLILVIALFAVFVFSAAAHSPPEINRTAMTQKNQTVLLVGSGSGVGMIANALVAKSGGGIVVIAVESPPENLNADLVFVPRITDLILPKLITAESAPAERDNRKTFRAERPPTNQKAPYDLPPERFSGFGFDNNARAKI